MTLNFFMLPTEKDFLRNSQLRHRPYNQIGAGTRAVQNLALRPNGK